MESLDIEVILGGRLDMSFVDNYNEREQRVVKTPPGREIVTDLVLLCTGRKPNTTLLKDMNPDTVDAKTGLAQVLRILQLSDLNSGIATLSAAIEKISLDRRADPGQDHQQETIQYPHIFVFGDATDPFGAIKARHNAYFQGEVEDPIELYIPGPPAIKVALGLTKCVYQVNNDGVEDLQALAVWEFYGIRVEDKKEMYD